MAAKKAAKKATKKAGNKKATPKKAAKKRAKRGRTTVSGGRQKSLENLQTPFVPTPEQRNLVSSLIGYGLKVTDVAKLVTNPETGKGVSHETLYQHFREEIESGRARTQAFVSESLFKKATSKDHPQAHVCAMFILKCQFGWRQADRVVHQHEGTSGVLVVPAGVDPEQWIREQNEKNAQREAPGEDDDA